MCCDECQAPIVGNGKFQLFFNYFTFTSCWVGIFPKKVGAVKSELVDVCSQITETETLSP